ncbi:30S ribosomal protein S16 [Apibacter adventoris]|uniref:Small ribosomal subunit protein bS16 n=1 Tax=Apibacter adventoris TaxID=1679466 RepID=A0A2S8A8R9_9FLAO|nr:30S ribosomal protein S16 [Apibacter adventoris]PQL90967.1 30S ribosomal protein S16 [Apibacter adventoris]
MAVKIRLQRHGKKGKPVFHIVVADSRSKRDGKNIEKLGIYIPTTNPATIELNVDKAVSWLEQGAQPTDTAKAILSYKGALLKKHLNGGVKKGAFSAEEAEKKFQTWLEEKEKAIQAKKDQLMTSKEQAKKDKHEAEKKVSDARLAAQQKAQEVAEENDAEEVVEEIISEDEAATDASDNKEESQA